MSKNMEDEQTDYIKREDAQKITAEWLSGYINDDERNVIERIDIDLGELPSADVVEIVRCKDCKHKYVIQVKDKFYKKPNRYYTCDYMNCEYDENNFCSYGERADT